MNTLKYLKVSNIVRTFSFILGMMLVSTMSFAQRTIPFEIRNTSPFPDSDLYVAVVGKDLNAGNHIWINPRNSQILPMNASYNTVSGPTPGGNMGPGQNGRYAACFVKLSEIPNKTFNLPPIQGCRVFISKGQQLYLYFFGSTGDPSGYAAPNHLNPSDPNNGIMFEMIELTNDPLGFFGNHSRVDAFRYPMGMELLGDGGYHQKVGELKSAAEMVALYKANVPAEFQGSVNSAGEIWAPSKTAAFQDGTNGSTPGPHGNYFKSYIDQIWEKYKNVDLEFSAGQAGVFRGRVVGEELRLKEINGGFEGRTGVVRRRPTTQEALEGKGVLDDGANHPDDMTRVVSLVVQSQLTAAINRHVVDVTTPNPGRQDWHNKANFYKANPMNHYAKFWHLPGINIDGLAYGFAYDDVADHSPSLHTPTPTRVIAVFGGYASGGDPNPNPGGTGVATVFKHCNYDGTSASLPVGDYTLSQLTSRGVLDNDISSLRVNSGHKVTLFDGDNFTGASVEITADNSCLVGNGWNDRTTSLRVATTTTGGTFNTVIEAESYVAMSGIQTEGCSEGGENVGWIETGDWMAYNVNIPTAGTYRITYRVASPNANTSLRLEKDAGATNLGTVTIPNTGGWQNWTNVSHNVTLPAGAYVIGLATATGGFNINKFTISNNLSARLGDLAVSQVNETTLYPNPVKAKINLTKALDANSIVQVLDLSGNQLMKVNLKKGDQQINVDQLAPGAYLIKITNNGVSKVQKIYKE